MRRKPLKCECVLEYMSETEARQLAAAEGLTLVPSEHSATGWYGVFLALGRNRPYMAHIKGTGIREYLGRYTTEWEAALIVARRLGPAGCRRLADEGGPSNGRYKSADFAAPPMDEQTVHATAAEEGLTLVPARGGKSGWKGVLQHHEEAASFNASLEIGGCRVKLGHHRTALEAALAYARYLGPAESKAAADHAESGARGYYKGSAELMERAMRDGAVRQDKQAIEDDYRDWREDTETPRVALRLAGAPPFRSKRRGRVRYFEMGDDDEGEEGEEEATAAPAPKRPAPPPDDEEYVVKAEAVSDDDEAPPPAPVLPLPVMCYCERPAALLDGRWVCAQLVEGDFCVLGRENE